MEMLLNGSALRTFHRTITCLARIGSELVVEAFPSQLIFHTINTSRSAYLSITLKANFFDVYSLSASSPVRYSVLLKAVCSILRTPVASIDRFTVNLPDTDAAKVQFTLQCFNGLRKTYWITCNVEPDIQHLSLDRGKFPSSLVVRPRDLSRLLGNFQSSLQEITVIATEPHAPDSNMGGEIGGKAVEIRSYIDPTKENSDTTLHTQLWIDPAEEFLQYKHRGGPADVTFSVKELKAFLAFCEGCEVDIHLSFEKAGEPILMAPRFGIEDGSNSDFDATLVLATMLASQLHDANNSEAPSAPEQEGLGSQLRHARIVGPSLNSDHPSDHTKIWSEISGCSSGRERQVHLEGPFRENQHDFQRPVHREQPDERQDRREVEDGNRWSQHHPCNWLDNEDDDDDEDEEEEFVQPTPEN